MHSRPPPSPTLAAAVAFGVMCLWVAVGMGVHESWGLRQWLIMLAAAALAIGGVVFVHRLEERHGVERWERIWRHPRAPTFVYCFFALLLVLGTVGVSSRSGSVLVGLIASPSNLGMGLGIALGAIGVKRISGGRYCAKCHYEMSDAIADDLTCQQCPECGRWWKRPGGTVGGRLILQWPWIAAGIVIGGTLFLWPFQVSSRPGLVASAMRYVPTNSLMKEAAWGFRSHDVWPTLMARQLSPAEEIHFAISLLDARSERGYMVTVADTWLQGRILAGALPQEIAQRYIDEHTHPHVLQYQGFAVPAAAAPTPGFSALPEPAP